MCAQACPPAQTSHTDKVQIYTQRKDNPVISTCMGDSLEENYMCHSYNIKRFAYDPDSNGICVSNDQEYVFLTAPLAHA